MNGQMQLNFFNEQQTSPAEDMVVKAMRYAERIHAGQVRPNGEAYILHVKRVAARFVNDPFLAVCAMLHDVIEDATEEHGGPEQVGREVLVGFGVEVFEVVLALTRREGERYLEQYIPRVKQDPQARLIKLADLADNMTNPLSGSMLARYGTAKRILEA